MATGPTPRGHGFSIFQVWLPHLREILEGTWYWVLKQLFLNPCRLKGNAKSNAQLVPVTNSFQQSAEGHTRSELHPRGHQAEQRDLGVPPALRFPLVSTTPCRFRRRAGASAKPFLSDHKLE